GSIKLSKPVLGIGCIEQRGARGYQQANREMHWINVLDQPALLKKVQQLYVALKCFPRREWQQRWPQGDADLFHQVKYLCHICTGVSLVQVAEHIIIERLDG